MTHGPESPAHAVQQRALAAGLMLVVLWGASFTIQKIAYNGLGPGGFVFGRALLMAVCALGLLALRGRFRWPQLSRPEWRNLLTLTAVGPVAHILMVTYGIHWSTPFSSSLILACGPVFTLLLMRFGHGTRLHRQQVLGVALALAGVLVFMGDKLLGADWRAGGGDLLLLVAAALFSAYTVGIAPLIVRHGGVDVTCWTMVLACPALMLATAVPAWHAPFATAGATTWVAFFWAVLVSAFMGWMLWGWINAVRGVARTAPLMYLIPPVAGLVAWLTVGETFGVQKIIGAALALAGVAWAQWAPRR